MHRNKRALAEEMFRFYWRLRQKGALPRPREHPNWPHFVKLYNYLELGKMLEYWKTYITAQFIYAHDNDRTRVFPQTFCSASAQRKYRAYLAYKTRRVGTTNPDNLKTEYVEDHPLTGVFRQSAWILESYIRAGFDEEEALLTFTDRFHPFFVLGHPGVRLKAIGGGAEKMGPKIQGALKAIESLRGARKNTMRKLLRRMYEGARREQKEAWDQYPERDGSGASE